MKAMMLALYFFATNVAAANVADFAVQLGGDSAPKIERAYYGCGEYRLDVETATTERNSIAVVWIRENTVVLAAQSTGNADNVFLGQGFRWAVAEDGSAAFTSVLPDGGANDMRLECKLIGKPGDAGLPDWDDRLTR